VTPDVCVLWRDRDGPVLEGGRARRVNLVKALGDRAEVCRLAGSYVDVWIASLVAAARTPARAVLVWFPDLPVWMPASLAKLPFALAWLALLRLILSVRGRALVADVGDVPRYQCTSLNYELSGGQFVWTVLERALFRLADRIAVTNDVIASWLARDHALPPERFRVVVNGAPRALLDVPRRSEPGAARFVYVGNLDATQDRGIRALCRAFASRAPGDAELVLIGEGGAWIERELATPGLRVLDAMPEERTYEWLARADFALIPYPTGGYYPAVCPTKLALYALARVPILSTDMEVSRALIERHGLGEVLAPAEVFARWPALAEKYRAFAGGRDLERLSWDAAAGQLL
jgi:glycosyltransferase involved in cell wall biosynthesis